MYFSVVALFICICLRSYETFYLFQPLYCQHLSSTTANQFLSFSDIVGYPTSLTFCTPAYNLYNPLS